MSRSTLPRTSYARKMNGFTFTERATGGSSHDGDRLDLDQPLGLGQRGNRDQRGGRALLAEELLADRAQLGAVANVREVRVQLDDVLHGAAARLHLRLHGLVHGSR